MGNQVKKRNSFYLNYEDEKIFLHFINQVITESEGEILITKIKILEGFLNPEDIKDLERHLTEVIDVKEVLIKIRNSLDKKYS